MDFLIFQGKGMIGKLSRTTLFCVVFFVLLNMNISITDNFEMIQEGQHLASNESRIVDIDFFSTADASWLGAMKDFFWETPKKYWVEDTGAELLKNLADAAAKPFIWAIEFVLTIIRNVLAMLLRVVGSFVDFSINGDFVRTVLVDNPGIYMGWSFVRDVLNLFFMFALLFSAFSTIFQVEKYHLKKIIILLVVMALLVNFSYPVTLVVIDITNSATFFLAGNVFGERADTSASAQILSLFSTGPLLKSVHSEGFEDAEVLLYEILFIAGALVVSGAYGVMLVVRLIVLALLLVFSPVGFVFAFFPGTKNLADSWWSNLFKYAMMGPILLFMLLLSFVIFSGSVGAVAADEELSFFTTLVMGILPMAFLIAGFVFSQKIGGVASSAGARVVDYSKKGANALWRQTGIPGGMSQRWGYIKSRTEANRKAREARGAAFAPRLSEAGRFGTGKIAKGINKAMAWTVDPKAQEKAMEAQADAYKTRNTDQKVLERKYLNGDAGAGLALAREGKMNISAYNELKKLKDSGKIVEGEMKAIDKAVRKSIIEKSKEFEGQTVGEITSEAQKGNMAAAFKLAQDGNMDDVTFNMVADIKDSKVRDLIEGKVKETRIDLVINREIRDEIRRTGATGAAAQATARNIAARELGNMNKDQWRKQNFVKMESDPILRAEAGNALVNLDPDALAEISRNLSGNDLAAMNRL